MSRILRCGCAALLVLVGAADNARSATIIAAKTENLLHNDTNSPFFTQNSTNNLVPAPGPASGWKPTLPHQAATAASVTTKKSFSFVGDSTAAGNWTNGNGVPAGITLAFDAEFTVTALASPGSFLTNPGTTATLYGRGIGVTQTVGGNDDIDAPDGLQFSAVTVSAVNFTGTLSDPGYAFAPGGVSGFGTILFRSGNFDEAAAGMVLTQGANTIGFGTATGNIASGLFADNSFGPPSSVFPRQSGPYTLLVTQGTAVIKGLTLGYDVTYDITAVPEPASLMLAAIGMLATCSSRRASRARS